MSNLRIIPPTRAALTCVLREAWFAASLEQPKLVLRPASQLLSQPTALGGQGVALASL